jgi:hypothetical protein
MALLSGVGIGGRRRALLSQVADEPATAATAAEAETELQTAQKTAQKEKWGKLHRHHRHHSHNPHSHHAHHSHHNHHHHTPSPTASPTHTPTSTPSEMPTRAATAAPSARPTAAPSNEPPTPEGKIGLSFMNKLKEVGCKALGKMGFDRVCGGEAGKTIQPTDYSEQESKMLEEFYIRTGSKVMLTTKQTTFVNVVPGGQLTSKGSTKDKAAVFEVVVIGGTTSAGGSVVAKFGSRIALKVTTPHLFQHDMWPGLHISFLFHRTSATESSSPRRTVASRLSATPKPTLRLRSVVRPSVRSAVVMGNTDFRRLALMVTVVCPAVRYLRQGRLRLYRQHQGFQPCGAQGARWPLDGLDRSRLCRRRRHCCH